MYSLIRSFSFRFSLFSFHSMSIISSRFCVFFSLTLKSYFWYCSCCLLLLALCLHIFATERDFLNGTIFFSLCCISYSSCSVPFLPFIQKMRFFSVKVFQTKRHETPFHSHFVHNSFQCFEIFITTVFRYFSFFSISFLCMILLNNNEILELINGRFPKFIHIKQTSRVWMKWARQLAMGVCVHRCNLFPGFRSDIDVER